MKKVEVELKMVDVKMVCELYGIDVSEFKEGNGIYKIEVGCRGEIESVEKCGVYMSLDEVCDIVGDDDYVEEFYGEEKWVNDGVEVFGVCYGEEWGVEFVNVMVE